MSSSTRKRGKKRSLAALSAEEFMRYSSSEENSDSIETNLKNAPKEHGTKETKRRKTASTGVKGGRISDTVEIPEVSGSDDEDRLVDGLEGWDDDSESGEFSELEEDDGDDDGDDGGDDDGDNDIIDDDDDDEVGVAEPRPLDVTSYKNKVVGEKRKHSYGDGEEQDDDGAESGSEDKAVESENEEAESDDDGVEAESEDDIGGAESGDEVDLQGKHKRRKVTLSVVKKWTSSIKETQSVHLLRKLCGSLHDAIANLLAQDASDNLSTSLPASSDVFNALVMACFKTVPGVLRHHLPPVEGAKKKSPLLPSSQRPWRRVRGTVRQYLSDLLLLLTRLQSSSMQCTVLEQLKEMAVYCVCFPKMLKKLTVQLVERWGGSDPVVQMNAFLCLRVLLLHQPQPALHLLLKRMYLSFVRECKFPHAAGRPVLEFMMNSLVELLSLDPPTSYQHGFVYIRQLAIHLRTALTANKKDSQQAVYNWQFVYCLKLWGVVLCEVSDPRLRPLVYPLVQVVIGAIQLQPSAKYHPLRLHLVQVLLQLAHKTEVFIPIAPYLLEVLEEHGLEDDKKKLTGGKGGDLSVLLRATSIQLNTRTFRTALVNESFQLLLQYFVNHSHFISFPELVFPTVLRLKAVSKNTKYSWLRQQLKQMIEKVDEISLATTRDRSKVTFSPKDTDQVTVWENDRKGRETSLSKFLSTWTKLNAVPDTRANGAAHPKQQEQRTTKTKQRTTKTKQRASKTRKRKKENFNNKN